MNETKTSMPELIIGLVARLGIETAIIVLSNLGKVTTIEEAIAALEASRMKTWDDYKKEA